MTTFTTARRAILQGLGRGGVYTTTGAGSTSTLVCTAFKSTLLPADYLDRLWAFVPSATAPRQRRVQASGLTVASGTITADDVYGSVIGTTTAFELSPVPLVAEGETGIEFTLQHALNEALRHLVFQDEIAVSVATTTEISLAALVAWLDRAGRLLRILEPSPVAGEEPEDTGYRPELVTSRWGDERWGRDNYRSIELILDAELPKLRIGTRYSAASGNLTLRAIRPADSWIAVGGTWAEASGLSAETDECKPDVRHCREAGLVFVYQALAASRTGPRRAEYQAKYEAQLALARQLPFWDHGRDDLLPAPSRAPESEAA